MLLSLQHQALSTINQRDYQNTVDAVRRLRLDEIDSQVRVLLRSINPTKPSALDLRLWQTLTARVQGLQQALQQQPFLPAPPTIIGAGDITIARQWHDAVPIRVSFTEMTRHAMVYAMTGSGKTTFLQHALDQILARGSTRPAPIRAWLLDLKRDMTHVAVDPRHGFRIIHADLPVNLLEPVSFLPRPLQIVTFISVFCKAFYSAEYGKQVLHEAFHNMDTAADHSSLVDLKDAVDRLYSKYETYARRDAVRGVSLRLQRLIDLYPGMARCRRGVPLEDLCTHSVYYNALNTDVDQFIWGLLVHYLFAYQRFHQHRNALHCVLFMDESVLSWNNDGRIEGAVLAELTGLLRESGVALWGSTNNARLIAPALKSNLYLQICMALSDGFDANEIARTFALNPAQREYLDKRLGIGQCIIRLGDRWREPLLATFDRHPADKTVSADAWAAAIQHTNNLAPPQTVPAVAVPEDAEHIPPNTPPIASNKEVPSNSAQTAASKKTSSNNGRAGLTRTEKRLQTFIADEGICRVTDAYRGINTHPQVADRARKKLERILGFLASERIKCGKGRGKTAIAVWVTPLGFEWLQRRAPHGMRGGSSAQHYWLAVTFKKLLSGHLEAQLQDKSIDVVWRVDSAQQSHAVDWLNKHAHALSSPPPAIASNMLVALEIELSEKTAFNNVVKDTAVGAAIVVCAVLERVLQTVSVLKRELPPELLSRVLIVDALEFLDHLRLGRREGTEEA